MQNDLIMNQIPFPKYYDGNEWNTVIKPTRKSIPKYLQQDLPELRHLYIKQIFKEMGKFNVPNLQFFNNMIKQKNKKFQKRSQSVLSRKDKSFSYNQVKEQFQYALLLMDRNSNVMDELVQKAQKVQHSIKNQNGSNNAKSFRSRSSSKHSFIKQNPKAKYFDHTVDLVFRNRRNKYIENLKKPKQFSEIPQKFQKRFQELKLLEINNPNL